jgi:hypothetical protein
MKILKSARIALLGAFLLAPRNVPSWAQAARQTGDQSQDDTSGAKKDKKTEKAGANASASQSAPDSAAGPSKKSAPKHSDAAEKGATTASSTALPSKPRATRQAPPANGAGMVWVNTDSDIYQKPGTHWYGKMKKGKYMTEADAIQAGYHAAKKE